jgi:hypothetical protein
MKLRSVTVKQFQEVQACDGDDLFKFIGVLEFDSCRDSMWHLKLHDGTGVLDVVESVIVDRSIDSQDERIKRESDEFLDRSLAPHPPHNFGHYHRVVGKRVEHGLEPVCIRQMSDMNEITTHNLECIFQFIQLHNKST